ncbi:hypothetical protein MU580_11975 [Clavibacter michiganensis subsp. michiganensis]|uniref:hypothetical protein n=1 Tax=Clavibacter michiganensis TaxID=28447 RepID=UPI001FF671BB|nr:hypothetical protein [Clavibacter michiganensis]UOW02985.1 hypothetical protein MU580_11975 [Clavibacter michiganensis subsp. michiganensis]
MGLIAAIGGLIVGLPLIALGLMGLGGEPNGPKSEQVPEYVWVFLVILGGVIIWAAFGG